MTAPAGVRRIVVIGAGLAGLCAARVVSEYADEVLIVERDRLPGGPQLRSGTPQARHLHTLLMRGQRDFELLFPGFGAELEAAGAVPIDLARYALSFDLGLVPTLSVGSAPASELAPAGRTHRA
ncbi:MAG TPA: NAD(P)-binding protein [Burkholderiaceae bacterium]|nr:NAD(P)-binding protein [Burkholderiaceae bacterium]